MAVDERNRLMELVTRWRKAASVDERHGAFQTVVVRRQDAADLERSDMSLMHAAKDWKCQREEKEAA